MNDTAERYDRFLQEALLLAKSERLDQGLNGTEFP